MTGLSSYSGTVTLALNLVPFAGIAFLWFIGVIRDRLGASEDRFFATVFLGSGLLFLAMMFASAAVTGGLIRVYGTTPNVLLSSGVYTFGRMVIYEIMTVYTMKMAGVFMISTCTLSLRTGIFPRWMAYLGMLLALILLLTITLIPIAPLLFPLWVLLISVYILLTNLRSSKRSRSLLILAEEETPIETLIPKEGIDLTAIKNEFAGLCRLMGKIYKKRAVRIYLILICWAIPIDRRNHD